MTDWLETCPRPSAWVSLDKSDSDLSVFLTYFIAAVRTLFPEAGADTLTMLQAPVLPPLSYLVTALANDLDRLADQADPAGRPVLPDGQRFILVLDDYHLIREPAIHELLGDLLRHPPRTLHLVISARLDPPFLPHSARSLRRL